MDAAYEKALGQKIRELRMRRGFSQVQLSAQLQVSGCDITRSALAKIEAGQRHIYPDEIRALRSILNVPYEELLDLPAGGAG
ncbi:MAG TPA: helix-turn-helix domain-containing protein [Candidatus Gemmiger faecigallinarum]|nr:helix-turn-helix domain-containing protein [Candidatus Gemmiger faecigallinarum]